MSKKSKKNISKGRTPTQMSDVGTQTEDNDDILSYKKQIEMLEKKVAEYQKQLNDLKNQTASNKFDTPLKNATITNEDKTLVGSSSKTKKGCSCKGSCSNSKCGCVKKGIFCDEFCKCITSKCSNQDLNKENILKKSVLSNEDLKTLEKLDRLSIIQETSHVAERKSKRNILNNVSVDPKIISKTEKTETSFTISRNKKQLFAQDSNELTDISGTEDNDENSSFINSKNSSTLSVRCTRAMRMKSSTGSIKNESTPKKDVQEGADTNLSQHLQTSDKENIDTVQSGNSNTTTQSPREVKNKIFSETPRFVSKRRYNKKKSPVKSSELLNIDSSEEDKKSSSEIVMDTVINPMLPKRQLPRSPVSSSNSELEMDLSCNPMKPTCQLPRSPINSSVVNSNTNEVDMDASLNPMMPKRQLPRSPIHVDGTTISQQSKRFSPPPEKELALEEVDWEEHQQKLVQCNVCKRRFWPHRIDKHVLHCKGW